MQLGQIISGSTRSVHGAAAVAADSQAEVRGAVKPWQDGGRACAMQERTRKGLHDDIAEILVWHG